ncbi:MULTISPECIES: TrkH family potassium uptake protein [Planktothrix]|uniref:Potassium uptake, TrkH family protein n=2 Tax=Planktothrix TaxID=54304 RepID=A0A6J7ZMC4_PLARU|nr:MULTISPECIES: TrkH family potassium uptake protein [Planktothrix]CAD5967892.1 Ktr system potassium uptake protein B [Planktothrix rubescens]CAC5343100.1 Potassium uptake, TrkH family protein [Planktothrix rubescens NIVA-CYA 18]CAD5976650.1 Ktr system potassium uptake protein B [Planktothrix rubescens NIVA-CYA 18]CAH2574734.1 Ktr system potassium uptake protein B [Planktothrix rubescens]GDZ95205.1 putative cation transporter family protein [Planktothrix agardhii CCAP 1459/11A]
MTVSRTIGLGFLAVIALGTILLMLPFSLSARTWGNPLTALFTSTSAVCVTGLSVVDVGKFYSFWGQFIIVLLVQVGGLGYMTVTTFLLLVLGRKFRLKDKLALQQSLDASGIAGAVPLLKSIVATTALFEITGVFLLLLVFVPDLGWSQGLWFAIFHSVNAFNNAGFGLLSDNFIRYVHSPILNFIITFLIIWGGMGYQVIQELYLWIGNRLSKYPLRRDFSVHFRVVTSTTIFLLILGTVLLFFTEHRNPGTLAPLNFPDQVMAAWFQSVTTRTAGFNTINNGELTVAGLFVTIILMFIGASPGGTGGGIKTTTVRILANSTRSALQGREEVICYKRQIPLPLILKAIGVLFGSFMVICISAILISLSQPNIDFDSILFEVVSAFATVGLSTGITASLTPLSQLIIITTMYVGRVGVILLMSAILGDPKPTSIDYPEQNLLVG